MEKLQGLLKHTEDIKESNADNNHGPHHRISSQLSVVLDHTSSQCLEDWAYKDVSTVTLPTVIPDTYKTLYLL